MSDTATRTYLIFIRCELGQTYKVAAELADLDSAPYVYSISGEYDLFCMFRLPSNDDVGRYVSDSIHKISGISSTNTIVCFNPFTPAKGIANT